MSAKKSKKSGARALATNRSARFEFELLERFEAGIALTGAEVKSVRAGSINLKEAYARIGGGEVYLLQAHINPYSHGSHEEADPVRPRKLLLNAREIRKLEKAVDKTSLTIVPTRVYLRGSWIKVELALARGKKQHDKRDAKRKQEVEREIARARGAREL